MALFWALLVVGWGLAVAAKALRALSTGEPYVFGLWDGGMLRRGKALTPVGARIKLGVGLVLPAISALLFARVLAYVAGVVVLLAVVVVSIGSDIAYGYDPNEGERRSRRVTRGPRGSRLRTRRAGCRARRAARSSRA